MDTQEIQTQLAQINKNIASLKGMTDTLSATQLQAALAPLQQKKAALEAQLSGSGAIAQGDGATAVGERGVNVVGDVGGNIITGDGNITTINYGVPAGGDDAALPPEFVPLRKMLVTYFSLSELQTLAFDLGVSYDDLPSSTRPQFAESLITHCYRNNQLPGLLRLCREQRPFVTWPQVS